MLIQLGPSACFHFFPSESLDAARIEFVAPPLDLGKQGVVEKSPMFKRECGD
jgi:hypothetical protein